MVGFHKDIALKSRMGGRHQKHNSTLPSSAGLDSNVLSQYRYDHAFPMFPGSRGQPAFTYMKPLDGFRR